MKAFSTLLFLTHCVAVVAGDRSTSVSVDEIRQAVQKAIPWIEKGAAGSSAHNKCFTCHNHGLPIVALTMAQRHGFDVEKNLEAQVEHTRKFLQSGKKRYEAKKGQGGGVLTAGYALWALNVAEHKPDDTTDLVASYVLGHQSGKDHWTKSGKRPPSDGNEFSVTYAALRAVSDYSPQDLQDEKQRRFVSAKRWLEKTVPTDTEDAVFRIRSMRLLNSDVLDEAVDHLLEQQRPDGGWAQTTDMKSDAYATGTALATLLLDGNLDRNHAAVLTGVKYLLNSQLADGTWHVVTRANGFQPYYESGFPHGEDQFISMAASSWAVTALCASLPERTVSE